MTLRFAWTAALAGVLSLAGLPTMAAADDHAAASYRDRLPEDELIYFLLPDRFENGDTANDRGGLKGGPLATGFDPTHKGFFHGGDIKGLTARLDYIQGMGVTAIWVAPIFKNRPVQGWPGQESAGYHGYWVTDFTTVDPHFGTEADFRALVDAAHARGMKVYMDIIVNHSADVIRYRECPANDCVYRSRADWPHQRRARDGAAINPGYLGDQIQTDTNMARLVDPAYAYTPFVPRGQGKVKVPAWLNDVRYYHNRGETTFWNESATMGDFVGLDDLMTEHPRVVRGFIDIYGDWIDRFDVDGFRVDTARHVNPEFWQAFVPAMLERARQRGIPNFHIFGEIGGIGLEPGKLAVHTQVDGFPAVLDFAFRQAVVNVLGEGRPTSDLWALYFEDPLYRGGSAGARQQPTFVSNHDNGRIGYYLSQARPKASDAELLQRVRLAHALMLTLRGVPTVYAGDEQGFVGDGNDQDAREDQFPSRVASYNDNRLLGTEATTAVDNFDRGHPLYRFIAELGRIRQAHAALRRGEQRVRNYGDTPGLFAVSRFDPRDGREYVLAFNSSDRPLSAHVEVEAGSARFTSLFGSCPVAARAPASLAIELAPLDFMICVAEKD